MASVRIKLPDQARVGAEGPGSSEVGGVVGAPKSTSTPESGKAGGGRESGAENGDDAGGALEVVGEGFEVGGGEEVGFGGGGHDDMLSAWGNCVVAVLMSWSSF